MIDLGRLVGKLVRKTVDAAEKRSETLRAVQIRRALSQGLELIEAQGIDRLVFSVTPVVGDPNVTGRWVSGQETNYYPYYLLPPEEQAMIEGGSSYEVTALVRAKVGDHVTYDAPGVEQYVRSRLIPFSPSLVSSSPLNYVTAGGVTTDLKQFSAGVAASGWISSAVQECIRRALRDHAGRVYDTAVGL